VCEEKLQHVSLVGGFLVNALCQEARLLHEVRIFFGQHHGIDGDTNFVGTKDGVHDRVVR